MSYNIKHSELSDFFVETFTLAKLKKDNNYVSYNQSLEEEVIKINLENKEIKLLKNNDKFKLINSSNNEDIVFNIPILEDPNKEFNINISNINIISLLEKFNQSSQSSLNIKEWFSDRTQIKSAIKRKLT
jgi:hypothetical protein